MRRGGSAGALGSSRVTPDLDTYEDSQGRLTARLNLSLDSLCVALRDITNTAREAQKSAGARCVACGAATGRGSGCVSNKLRRKGRGFELERPIPSWLAPASHHGLGAAFASASRPEHGGGE